MKVDKPEWFDANSMSGDIKCGGGAHIIVRNGHDGNVMLDDYGPYHNHNSLHVASVELMRLSLYLKSLEK